MTLKRATATLLFAVFFLGGLAAPVSVNVVGPGLMVKIAFAKTDKKEKKDKKAKKEKSCSRDQPCNDANENRKDGENKDRGKGKGRGKNKDK